jgi:hypothetical protein
MSLLLPIATSLAPTLIKGGLQALGGSKQSPMEKKYKSMMDVLEGKLDQPLQSRGEYKRGRAEILSADERNKEKAENVVGAGNYTNDAKLAVMESTNKTFGSQLNDLMSNVASIRDMDQSRLLGVMQALQGAKAQRVSEYNQKLGSILDPLAEAGGAWLQAELNAPSGGKKKKKGK